MAEIEYFEKLADSMVKVDSITIQLLAQMVGTFPGDPFCSNEELKNRFLRAVDMQDKLEQSGEWQIFLGAQIKEFILHTPLYKLLIDAAGSTIRRMATTGLNTMRDCEAQPFSDRRKTNIYGGPGFQERLLAEYEQEDYEIKPSFTDHEIALLRQWKKEVIGIF